MPRRHPQGVGFTAQSILDVEEGTMTASRPVCFTTEERASGINRIGGWLVSRAGMDVLEQTKVFSTYRDLKPASSLITVPTYLQQQQL